MRIAIASLVATLALVGCGSGDDDGGSQPSGVTVSDTSFRRVTVVVDTPEGQVTGHSVNAAITVCGPSLPGNQCTIYQAAEAVPLDLPNGKTLYALLSRKGDNEWTVVAPPDAWREKERDVQDRHYNPGWYPDFVMFGDEKDPKTVKFIDAEKPFGEGYRVVDVYLSKDPGPKTDAISKRLPWSNGLVGSLSGNPSYSLISPDDADRLTRLNFKKGELNAQRP